MNPDYVADLRRGIASGEVRPYFQPLVELRTGQLSGFEVLARWKHPLRGMVPPDEFIQVAEDSACLGQLTTSVLLQAFAAMQPLSEHLRLSINVSAVQLRDHALQRLIALAAEQTRFGLERLTVEITESALVGNVEHARSVTEELKARGVRLALDDFGTGYSSLRHLHALPFDEIKVDQSFVQTMQMRRESRKIVAAIVGLGQSLGLQTAAEGVESQAQADMLQWLGCDLGQGWLYGRPMPVGKLAEYVQDAKPSITGDGRQLPAPEEAAFPLEALPSQRLSQLQAIYDGAPVGLCFVDRNMRYVSVNKRLAEMNHAPIVAHLGRTVEEMIPNFYPQLEPFLRRALQGEAFSGLEVQADTRDGKMHIRSTSYQPTRDEGGEIVGVSVAVLDVTERETTQEALKESEDHHRFAVALNPHVYWTADEHGAVLEAGPRWTELTGMSADEARGWGWAAALHPDDLQRITPEWESSLSSGSPLDVEYRIRLVDGSWRWMRARATARRNQQGRVFRWYGVLDDIQEHKEAMERVHRSQTLLEGVIQSVPVGMVVVEAPSGRLVMRNAQAASILDCYHIPDGLRLGQAEWLCFYDAQGKQLQRDQYPLQRTINSGEPCEDQSLQYLRPDGRVIWLTVSARPLRDAAGQMIGAVATLRDVDQEMCAARRLQGQAEHTVPMTKSAAV
ncbi:MAG: EAL domain-containing protein [Acidobacteriota bacterium]|nr:EAL domain-containing protein [Acidobacteriota bacterium]